MVEAGGELAADEKIAIDLFERFRNSLRPGSVLIQTDAAINLGNSRGASNEGAAFTHDGSIMVPGDIVTAIGGKVIESVGRLPAIRDDYRVWLSVKRGDRQRGVEMALRRTVRAGGKIAHVSVYAGRHGSPDRFFRG